MRLKEVGARVQDAPKIQTAWQRSAWLVCMAEE